MTQIVLPEGEHPLVFYLAAEEFVADNFYEIFSAKEAVSPADPSRGTSVLCSTPGKNPPAWNIRGAFFIWQVPPTVIFGRNQDMNAEVNVSYCRSNGVRMFRRKSGGGCVYADWGNIMISYIRPCADGVQSLFSEYLSFLSSFLRALGLNAEVSGRNDVLVDGRKVSGNAFSLRTNGVGIVHGTLLYDLDFSAMSAAITPSRAKLESKGVKSVEQRVLNLKEKLDGKISGQEESLGRQKTPSEAKNMGLDALKSAIISYFCCDELKLSEGEISQISEIERTYLDPVFIRGRRGVSDDSL